MLKNFLAASVVLAALCCSAGEAAASGKSPEAHFSSFRAFPPASDRAAWEKARDAEPEFAASILRRAEASFSALVPPCSAIKFMEFNRNGNRINYEKEYFERRNNLQVFAVAEALEYRGRYMDRIIEYLCAISDEYTWAIPAHTAQRDVLPYMEMEEIDLFSAETSNTIAQTLMLLEKELAAISPNLVKRLKKQLITRAIMPVETALERYWWKDLVSNWNPWICSNLLWTANTVLADEPERLGRYAEKLAGVTERYYQSYMNDGGSEEGSSYWTVSPVTYFLFQEALYRMSGGRINRFGDAKFRKMCEFITASQFAPGEFVTFSDSHRKIYLPLGICRLMAERLDSEPLLELSSAPQSASDVVPRTSYGGLDTLFRLFQEKKQFAPGKRDYLMVYPELEQLFCRRGDAFFAVKAGNNGEGHGHLDAGQFVFRKGGKFLALDLGTAVYSKDTFNENRFKNFTVSAASHNPLRFNGIGQGIGKKFAAADFSCREENGTVTVSMELAGCYPASLGLTSYRRTLVFDGASVRLRDEYRAKKPLAPEMTVFSETANSFSSGSMTVKSESFPLEDSSLKRSWGDSVIRTSGAAPAAEHAVLECVFELK